MDSGLLLYCNASKNISSIRKNMMNILHYCSYDIMLFKTEL